MARGILESSFEERSMEREGGLGPSEIGIEESGDQSPNKNVI